MHILYIYDLKAKNKKTFNRTKRLFYYHLNQLPLKKHYWKTKSALAVPLDKESMVDAFFKRFKDEIIVYKVLAENIEELK